jgi:hypothetical protein
MDKKDSKAQLDPWEIGQITERLPAWEMWEDGVEPVEDEQIESSERAA